MVKVPRPDPSPSVGGGKKGNGTNSITGPSLIILMVSVDVKHHERRSISNCWTGTEKQSDTRTTGIRLKSERTD